MFRSKSEWIYAQLGKLVIAWNDLDLQLRRILFALSGDMPTAAILSADFQAVGLLNAIRTTAAEYDAHNVRLNVFLKEASSKTGRSVRHLEAVCDHVNHLIECADLLREWRNYYAHGLFTPDRGEPFSVGGMTARGRLTTYEEVVTLPDLKSKTAEIDTLVGYAKRLTKCIEFVTAMNASEPPTWPKKPALPAKLKKPRTNLLDRIPLL